MFGSNSKMWIKWKMINMVTLQFLLNFVYHYQLFILYETELYRLFVRETRIPRPVEKSFNFAQPRLEKNDTAIQRNAMNYAITLKSVGK